MSYYEEVQKYEKQIARKNYIKPRLPELKNKRWELKKRVEDLERKKLIEDEDVKRLESHSLASFVYTVTGKKKMMLEKENQEACEATAKYKEVLAELETVEKDIHKMEYDLECYVNAEKNYEEALKKWMDEVATTSVSESQATEIRGYQRQLNQIQARKKEIKDAKMAADKALSITEWVIAGLHDAKNWGLYDTFVGGGLLVDMAKYDSIDDVQGKIVELNKCLSDLKKELKDIEVQGFVSNVTSRDMQLVDVYFDNIFTDWTVLSEIKESKKEAESVLTQLQDVVEYVKKLEISVSEEEATITSKLAEALKGREQ